ncbi:MAG TPA: hybrid sensor histidine kinase/response regulator [Polyangiaceae bacterium]|nr:hybrid sensor histidine kinase/response regulator [Polyangiaceae bacterium]
MAYRVMVVDSEVEGLAGVQSQLAGQGCAFVWALTGHEALELADGEPLDLAVVDARLSDRNGVDVVIELRRRPRLGHLPIVLTIPRGDAELRVRGSRSGADEVLEKPLDAHSLTICARQLLRLKAVRDELELRKRELQNSYQEQRKFVETLVHDLKNPIAVVHVNLAWVIDRMGEGQPEYVEALADAQDGIARLQKMADDLLTVGMLDQAALPLKRESIRVADLLNQVIKAHEREAIARNVSVSLSLDENVSVMGDSSLLRRAVTNLLESSLRHTPSSGRVELSARFGDGVEISVSNTGHALPAEEKAQLLDKSASGHRSPPGGLGLYFSKRAVEAHDGNIDVVESAEWPTSLILRLPGTSKGSGTGTGGT